MSDTSHNPSCHIPHCNVISIHRHELVGDRHMIFLTGAGDFAPAKTEHQRELAAIRAFVGRVRWQREAADISYGKAIQDELAAMEEENVQP